MLFCVWLRTYILDSFAMKQKNPTSHVYCYHSTDVAEGRRVILFYSMCRLNIREENRQVQHRSISCLDSLIGLYTSKRIIKLLQIMSLWERITQEAQQKRSMGIQSSPFHVHQGCHLFMTSDAKSPLSSVLSRVKGCKTYSEKNTMKWKCSSVWDVYFNILSYLVNFLLWSVEIM